jgi:hypothetical protein
MMPSDAKKPTRVFESASLRLGPWPAVSTRTCVRGAVSYRDRSYSLARPCQALRIGPFPPAPLGGFEPPTRGYDTAALTTELQGRLDSIAATLDCQAVSDPNCERLYENDFEPLSGDQHRLFDRVRIDEPQQGIAEQVGVFAVVVTESHLVHGRPRPSSPSRSAPRPNLRVAPPRRGDRPWWPFPTGR